MPIFKKNRFVLVAFVLFGAMNCSESPDEKKNVRQTCPNHFDVNFFFPSTIDSSSNTEMASAFLARFGEPSLSCGSEPFEGYRLIDGRADDVRVIRLTNRNGDARLSYVRDSILPNQATLFPGVAIVRPERRERSLSAAEWQSVDTAVSTSAFWTEPGSIPESSLDGFLLIEGRRGVRYRALSRVGLDLKVNNAEALASAIRKLAGATAP